MAVTRLRGHRITVTLAFTVTFSVCILYLYLNIKSTKSAAQWRFRCTFNRHSGNTFNLIIVRFDVNENCFLKYFSYTQSFLVKEKSVFCVSSCCILRLTSVIIFVSSSLQLENALFFNVLGEPLNLKELHETV